MVGAAATSSGTFIKFTNIQTAWKIRENLTLDAY